MATTRNLPVETIEIEILPRLPVRSLLRFKSVCKSWNSLISSNVFVKSVRNSNHDCLTLISRRRGDHDFMGCINGLVFIEVPHYFGSDGFKIWNPATKQFLEIERPLDPFKFGLKDYLPGFGFDSVADDYKCMYITLTSKRPLYGHIYSCKARRWSKITRSNFLNPGFAFYNVLDPVIIVNGSPFWMITQVHDTNLRMIVMSLDVRQESFRLLPDLDLSGSTFTGKFNGEYKLLNFRDSLAIMYYSSTLFFGETIDIYVFNENGDNWSKTAFGPFEALSKVPTSSVEPRFLQCSTNGDILFSSSEAKIVYWVDLENYTIKSLGKRGVSRGHTYSESLVFIDGMKPLHEEVDRFQFFFLRKDCRRKTRAGKKKYRRLKCAKGRNKQDDELKQWNRTNTLVIARNLSSLQLQDRQLRNL